MSSRRETLRAAAALVTGLAGCLGDSDGGRTDPAVGNWLVAPVVYTFDLGGFAVAGQSPSSFAETAALSTPQQESLAESLRERVPSVELAPADVALVFANGRESALHRHQSGVRQHPRRGGAG